MKTFAVLLMAAGIAMPVAPNVEPDEFVATCPNNRVIEKFGYDVVPGQGPDGRERYEVVRLVSKNTNREIWLYYGDNDGVRKDIIEVENGVVTKMSESELVGKYPTICSITLDGA